MTSTFLRRAAAPGILTLAVGLSLSACGAANEDPGAGTSPDSTSEGSPAAGGSLSGTLNGAGSSAQEAAMAAWQSGFQKSNGDVTVNYDPSGSGAGREQFIAGGVEFAGSDAYLTDDEGEMTAAKKRCLGEDPIEVPSYVSPIAVIYNLSGVDELQLSPDTIAGIFNGSISKWNDPAITKDNPDATLPGDTITPVHRADDSGTTENFTDYLSQASTQWKAEPDGVWPLKSGEAAQGTSGVVSAVTEGSGTIGYADASQAGDLGVALVKVGEDYVGPTAEAAAKILEVSKRVEGRAESNMAFELDRATEDSGAYPVVLASYLIACPTYDDAATADLVKGFVSYVVSEEGQQAASESAGSAPLPAALSTEAVAIAEKITGKS